MNDLQRTLLSLEPESTLYVSDMDGTLLSPDARLTRHAVELLNDAIDHGVRFTVATARTPATVNPIMHSVRMTMPAIVMTGAAWWNMGTERYSNVKFFEAAEVKGISRLFKEAGVRPFVYTLPGLSEGNSVLNVYFDDPHPSEIDLKFIEQRKGLPLKHIKECPDSEEERERAENSTVLFFASGDGKRLGELARAIREMGDIAAACYDDVYNPGTALIEVFTHGVSKASAIEEMRHTYPDVKKIVVFGDNHNDLSAFRVADISVAVSNAPREICAAADIVIGPNTEDSVAEFLSAAAHIRET